MPKNKLKDEEPSLVEKIIVNTITPLEVIDTYISGILHRHNSRFGLRKICQDLWKEKVNTYKAIRLYLQIEDREIRQRLIDHYKTAPCRCLCLATAYFTQRTNSSLS